MTNTQNRLEQSVSSDGVEKDFMVDQRSDSRVLQTLLVAKLIAGGFEYPCIVTDTSPKGLRVRLLSNARALGEEATIEFANGTQRSMQLIWSKGLEIGFRFADEIELADCLSGGRFAERPLRIGLGIAAMAGFIPNRFTAIVHNISQQGICLETEEVFKAGDAMRVELPQTNCRFDCTVRWRQKSFYGLSWSEGFQLHDFAEIITKIRA